jgi:hypothetical protein
LVALLLVAGAAPAAEKKKGKTVSGKFESYADGVLKIKVGKKGEEPKVQDFKIPDDLKVAAYIHDEKKEVAVKDAFANLKPGSNVVVKLSDDDKVTAVQTGNAPHRAAGTLVSFKHATLTLKVKGKNGEESKEFQIADETKAVTLTGGDKKEATAKEALKDLKEGTPVTLTVGGKNKVLGVQVGSAKKK